MRAARRVAEAGAREAVARLGAEPRLAAECAYEHWHRLLFARFLAENDLLVDPISRAPLSLAACRELSRHRGVDWLAIAGDCGGRVLPQIFRAGDPGSALPLPPDRRRALETLLEGLPREVFVAEDSLGWVYQFWQAEERDRINTAEKKIGAEDLPAVTQLFTEDYMVLFLLHNTLGAWWAAKVLAARPEAAAGAGTEDDLRRIAALPGVAWEYLRFVRGGDGAWRPAAGTFAGWPRAARELRVLDPCMGSGRFLVSALVVLAALRAAEEGLAPVAAVDAALRDNLFGLEIDPRCAQIAVLNVAVSAWRESGHRALPELNLACSGLAPAAPREEWRSLAGDDLRRQRGMARLHELFEQAPVLGSLLDPRAGGATSRVAGFAELSPLVERAMAREETDFARSTMGLCAAPYPGPRAAGMARATAMLAGSFTLVITNVPYLARGKQDDALRSYADRRHESAKADLATCFVERCLTLCADGGSAALVTPQSWLYLRTYARLRRALLASAEVVSVARLGPNAFHDMNWWAATTALVCLSRRRADPDHRFAAMDVAGAHEPEAKAAGLVAKPVAWLSQSGQMGNADARIVLSDGASLPLLREYVDCLQGTTTGDNARHVRKFWELGSAGPDWEFFQGTVESTHDFGGRHEVLRWEGGGEDLARSPEARVQGRSLLDRPGVFVGQMGDLPVTRYCGQLYNMNGAALVPRESGDLPALWAFCSSPELNAAVRHLDQGLKVTNATLAKVPFDLDRWRRVAALRHPHGLPPPHSNDPTQWIFAGHPRGAEQPLQVAVARLLGYRWPRQTGSSFPGCPAVGADGLEEHAAEDGIVCSTPLDGEPGAADRIRALLEDAFGCAWSPATLEQLLDDIGYGGRTLEAWLRDGFFEQHCQLFHQRPFVWQIGDGLEGGFSALVNYHRLAAPDGGGRRTLETLVHRYLDGWIGRQLADRAAGVEGAVDRVAAARHLRRELEKILAGEGAYDIFVRWKPLHQQPVGWEPDIRDGVRPNIRPFMKARPLGAKRKDACLLRVTPRIQWAKDRGREPDRPQADYPWLWSWDGATRDFRGGRAFDGVRHNDLHYSRALKLAWRASFEEGGSRRLGRRGRQ